MNRKRIDTVLRVRELQERLARQTVVAARMELVEHERAERHARAQVADRSRSAFGPMSASRLVDRRHMLSSGVEHTVRLAGHVHGAERVVDGAMASWRIEAERLDGIERLSDRATAHDREELARAEATAIDDLVIGRWGRGERAHDGNASERVAP